MRRFDGLNIELTRGDSTQFKVNFAGQTLPEGAMALFTVKKSPRSTEPVIEKRMDIAAGSTYVWLSNKDTDIQPRTYYWDIRVLVPFGDGTYDVKTPMQYASFTILEVIGDVGVY